MFQYDLGLIVFSKKTTPRFELQLIVVERYGEIVKYVMQVIFNFEPKILNGGQ